MGSSPKDMLKNFSELGIGVDIEEISRFSKRKLSASSSFLRKIFTKNELNYCFTKTNPAQHLAARYAGKEAVVKALSCVYGSRHIGYSDIEILKNKNNIPIVKIKGFSSDKIKIHISLSHCEDKAIAFAVVATIYEKTDHS